QEKERFRQLVQAQLLPEDLKHISEWLEEYVRTNEAAIIAKLPQNQRWLRAEQDPVKRLRQLRFVLFNQGGGAFLASVPEEEIDNLLGSLKSPEALKAHEAVKEPEKK